MDKCLLSDSDYWYGVNVNVKTVKKAKPIFGT
jgi:hypothetical protein